MHRHALTKTLTLALTPAQAPYLGLLGLVSFSGSRFSQDNFASKGLSGGDGPFFSPF